MTIRDDITAELDDTWFDDEDLAVLATYKVGGAGVGTSVPILYQDGADLGEDVRYYGEFRTIIVKVSDISEPEQNDTITESGDIWIVRKVISGNGFSWFLACDRKIKASA